MNCVDRAELGKTELNSERNKRELGENAMELPETDGGNFTW